MSYLLLSRSLIPDTSPNASLSMRSVLSSIEPLSLTASSKLMIMLHDPCMGVDRTKCAGSTAFLVFDRKSTDPVKHFQHPI